MFLIRKVCLTVALVLTGLASAQPGTQPDVTKPLGKFQVLSLLSGGVSTERLTVLVKQHGIDFEPNDDYLLQVHRDGGDNGLILALQDAGELHTGLVYALDREKQLDDWAAKLLKDTHSTLKDSPSEQHAHLALVLHEKGDLDAAIVEYNEALRLDPSTTVHLDLGLVWGEKGDWGKMAVEERESLRTSLVNDLAHFLLGVALEHQGDLEGAKKEYFAARLLKPEIEVYRRNYERLRARVK